MGLEVETQKWAQSDLAQYRRGKQNRTTKMLIRSLIDSGVGEQTLLDIGGGIGEIPLELLAAGAASATSVEISTAYINTARREAARKGLAERISWLHGDFVTLADQVPDADIVALNRTVCCYPDYQALVGQSVSKAGRIYALVIPRDWWINRLALKIMNWFYKAQKSLYVAYVHPVDEIDQMIQSRGFKPQYRQSTLGWHVWVYARGQG
ncbi:MAG: class I SAM-dependent methyltransferase [Bellilinea sp.]